MDLDSFARHKYFRLGVEFSAADKADWIGEIPPADIAKTGQSFFQNLLSDCIRNLLKETGMSTVACSGGAFLNAAANGALAKEFPTVDFYVPMAPHDAGLSLGAALWTQHHLDGTRPKYPVSPFLGPSFSSTLIEQLLSGFSFPYSHVGDATSVVANEIAGGKIVGWFEGRAEYGARALGARSVLADPRNPSSKARLNQLLKKRDWFMPYAPAVLEECGDEYFDDFRPSPYMAMTFNVRQSARHMIPSACHVDGTSRVQSVARATNPAFHAVISSFRDVTGIPMVLNTSFNKHGLPMVATPRHALQHLAEGCVDLLVMGGFIVRGLDSNRGEEETDDELELLGLLALRRAGRLAKLGQPEGARRLLERAGSMS